MALSTGYNLKKRNKMTTKLMLTLTILTTIMTFSTIAEAHPNTLCSPQVVTYTLLRLAEKKCKGNRGIQSLVVGSHESEVHCSNSAVFLIKT